LNVFWRCGEKLSRERRCRGGVREKEFEARNGGGKTRFKKKKKTPLSLVGNPIGSKGKTGKKRV